MNRTAIDRLISWTGLILAVVLLAGGGLLSWGYSFANTSVNDQLAAQDISFPAESDTFNATTDPELVQWAGQKVTQGDQAYGYANYYIAKHMAGAVAGWNSAHPDVQVGDTYSAVSGVYMGMLYNPESDQTVLAALGQLRQTMFMGDTLRGLLMTTYAFWTFGQIAFYASIGCFVAGAALLLLAWLGFRHAKTVQE